MHIEKKTHADGSCYNLAVESYIDPLTQKRKRCSVSFNLNTARAKAQARRELNEKITGILEERESSQAEIAENLTFGKLKQQWLDEWSATVKPQTMEREKVLVRRVSALISDDILVKKITPLLIRQCIDNYQETYQSTFTTMQHIKSTLNKIFDFAVLYNYLSFSPARVVKVHASVNDKIEKKERLERKFLNAREVQVLIKELQNRRNPAYLDLTLFLIGTGCRIGEAGALTAENIDFDRKTVSIQASLQSTNLRVKNYYLDTTKTSAGERIEALPDFAISALKRCLERNKLMDDAHRDNPSDAFTFSKSIFRTEYGSPITSHSFREVLGRINRDLEINCQQRYGFKWTKNVVPHSFRHIHVSILRADPSIPLKEVQQRVGHLEEETTAGYTHLMNKSQKKSVEAVDRFASQVGILD
ncbi:tyrosine-type recombinase/integrase [Secundilactobacillus mixtipabuli]|uniref:Integrase n=1 Tax=Secundilactobacillus mixtipabuli TaxID=1435342 RepID=A0A1Z5ID61_9LACO|nr:site-specific integrase [Secundilactobacillus mixtipabuli]GAW99588.1 integrase [Secundilactobacillus mixtipabuli]